MPSHSFFAPFGFIAGVAGIATFYLPQFVFPVLLSLAAVGLGMAAYLQGSGDKLARIAIGLGGLGLVLELIAFLAV